MRHRTTLIAALSAAAAGAVEGCSATNPWTFERPPAVAARHEAAGPPRSGRAVIAVARFTNPTSSQLKWRDVGEGMADALRRALLNEGDFEVRMDGQTERLFSQVLSSGSAINNAPSDVDYIITGKVTDFLHTSALPSQVSRWGLFKKRSEAVVAIEWSIVDARSRRVVVADHVYGTASAGREPQIKDLYTGLDFDSYLFWSTPLGKASRQAVERTIQRIRAALPSHVGEPRIVKVIGRRKLAIIGGWASGLASGQEYYLYIEGDAEAPPQPIYDVDTGQPLVARIDDVRKASATAWLRGKSPVETTLRGALLSRQRPTSSPDVDGRAAAAEGSEGSG